MKLLAKHTCFGFRWSMEVKMDQIGTQAKTRNEGGGDMDELKHFLSSKKHWVDVIPHFNQFNPKVCQ